MASTSYITSRKGSISQHVEYIAFGEVLFVKDSSSFSSPYLFNGKELDRETNLSYYGARYLDMKTSLWLSVDPLALFNPTVGGVGGIVTAETGVGTVVGYAVLMNGIVNTVIGAKQMWTGESESTLLHKGVSAGSKALGASDETSENIATGADIATIAVGGVNSFKNTKILKESGGKINGISKGSKPGYGAQKRFDIHPLKHPSKATNKLTIPKIFKEKKYQFLITIKEKGNNLKIHRPWEVDMNGKRIW